MGFTLNPPNAALVGSDGRATPEFYRFLAQVERVLGNDQVGDISQSPVLTYSSSSIFTNERFLVGGAGLTLDVGVGAATMNIDDTSVTAGTYGSNQNVVAFTVNQQGRITDAEEFALDSDNVTEGAINLFYTDTRARDALSDGTGLSYNSGTGVFSATPAGSYGTPSGTLSRSGFGTYTAPTISNPPTQAEVQAVADAVQIVSRTLAALITDMEANGNLS